MGVQALLNNTTGNSNSAMGLNALLSNTTGVQNSAVGQGALQNTTTVVATFGTITGGTGYTANLTASAATLSYVSGSTAISYPPVLITTNASGVVTACTLVTAADGTKGGTGFKDITTVMTCTTIGAGSGFAISPATLSTGSYNSAVGMQSLLYNTTGVQNSAMGVQALFNNTTGNYNSAVGANALQANTTGVQNSAVGLNALQNNTTGNYNSAMGVAALNSNTTGSGNSAFNPMNSAGTYAPVFNPTVENNRLCMGSTGVTNAYIQVPWTVISDARDKTNFAPVPHGLEFVNQLKPTAYQFKEDRETDVATGIVRYGFKAQDILALEGDTPVIIDTENLDKLRFNSDSLIPVLVNAIKELTARLELLEGK